MVTKCTHWDDALDRVMVFLIIKRTTEPEHDFIAERNCMHFLSEQYIKWNRLRDNYSVNNNVENQDNIF